MRTRIIAAVGLREGEGACAGRLIGLVFALTSAVVLAKTAQRGVFLSAYSRARSAGELARIGAAAGCEFDKNSAAPVRLHTIKLKKR